MKWLKLSNFSARNITIITLSLMIGSLSTRYISCACTYTDSFAPLQSKLICDGFDNTRINDLYSNPKTCFDIVGVARYFVHNEAKLNYDQFTNQAAIESARKYISFHNTDLTRAEKKYGVNKEIIVAILLVETRLGTYVGKKSVFNTLSTMAALMERKTRTMVWKRISFEHKISKEIFETKANKKSTWAYRELKAFLNYTKQQKIDPLYINGSYAGAIGIPQFMPSSLILLGEDGNNDGSINLFEHIDAICSIANYLKYYGWSSSISPEKATQVIRHYNNSGYYTNTVMKIADLLRG